MWSAIFCLKMSEIEEFCLNLNLLNKSMNMIVRNEIFNMKKISDHSLNMAVKND